MTPHTETLWIAKYDPALDSGSRAMRAQYEPHTLSRTRDQAWAALREPLDRSDAPYRKRGWRVVKVTVEEVK